MTHHSRQDSSGQVISSSQTSDNTQYPQETDIHDPGGIGNRNLSKRAAADPLRPRGHLESAYLKGRNAWTADGGQLVCDRNVVQYQFSNI
jgi:hypothetical protein